MANTLTQKCTTFSKECKALAKKFKSLILVDKWQKGYAHTLLDNRLKMSFWGLKFSIPSIFGFWQVGLSPSSMWCLLSIRQVKIHHLLGKPPQGGRSGLLLSASPYVFPDQPIPDCLTFQPKLISMFRLSSRQGGWARFCGGCSEIWQHRTFSTLLGALPKTKQNNLP